MRAKDFREMDREDLEKKEKDLREDLFKLQFQHSIRQIENPARLRQLRRDIARIKTIVNE